MLVITLYRQVTDILPTHHQLSADCRSSVGRLIVCVLGKTCRPTVDRQSANRRPTGFLGPELFFTITQSWVIYPPCVHLNMLKPVNCCVPEYYQITKIRRIRRRYKILICAMWNNTETEYWQHSCLCRSLRRWKYGKKAWFTIHFSAIKGCVKSTCFEASSGWRCDQSTIHLPTKSGLNLSAGLSSTDDIAGNYLD